MALAPSAISALASGAILRRLHPLRRNGAAEAKRAPRRAPGTVLINIIFEIWRKRWRARKDSNPQPPDP
jgi:hypothetical protein